MNVLLFAIGASVLLAVVSSSNVAYYVPAPKDFRSANILLGAYVSALPLTTPTQQQYHAQDEYGQYSYGYSDHLSAKQEVRSLDGVTRGSYSYRDAEGKLQTVDYTADDSGFHVAATNLPRAVPIPEVRPAEAPVPVSDTVEVIAARDEHLAAHQEARLRLAPASPSISVQASSADLHSLEQIPQPVQDTPEVAAAKAEHFKKLEQETLRNEALSKSGHLTYQVKSPFIQTYHPSGIIPSVYAYSYPLSRTYLPAGSNSRFLASNIIY